MRIFQITDLHIGSDGELPNGIDVRKNFLEVMGQIPRFNPDLIVITGDLCFKEPKHETYRWIRSRLSESGLPFYIIPGNHDEAPVLRQSIHDEHMSADHPKWYYYLRIGHEFFLFLDTGDALISDMQAEWMQNVVSKFKPDRLFVFMHHPPVLAGVPHMDGKYALKDRHLFEHFADAYQLPVFVYCGHYHVEKSLSIKNVQIFICPSTFFQIDSSVPDFAIDHREPGFRIIDICDEIVRSQVHYTGR